MRAEHQRTRLQPSKIETAQQFRVAVESRRSGRTPEKFGVLCPQRGEPGDVEPRRIGEDVGADLETGQSEKADVGDGAREIRVIPRDDPRLRQSRGPRRAIEPVREKHEPAG